MDVSIFYDNDNVFQWASVAAVIAGFGAISSLLFSFLSYRNSKKALKQQKELEQKKIDANLKASARLKWIEQVREIVSQYLSELSKLSVSTRNLIKVSSLLQAKNDGLNPPFYEEELNMNFEENVADIIKLQNSVNEYSEKILLYFSDKDDHKKIEEMVSLVPNKLGDFLTFTNNNINHNFKIAMLLDFEKELNKNVQDIRKVFRDYLKKEWDKAKQGK